MSDEWVCHMGRKEGQDGVVMGGKSDLPSPPKGGSLIIPFPKGWPTLVCGRCGDGW